MTKWINAKWQMNRGKMAKWQRWIKAKWQKWKNAKWQNDKMDKGKMTKW